MATHLDGQPMALGGLGPLWAVYEADRFPDMAAKPLPARFESCPWATYHIEVREGQAAGRWVDGRIFKLNRAAAHKRRA